MSGSFGENVRKREEADADILVAVRLYPGITFSELQIKLGIHWRQVETSLQRLRKAGRIQYSRKDGWTPLTFVPDSVD